MADSAAPPIPEQIPAPAVFVVHGADNVGVALRDIAAGEEVGPGPVRATEAIPRGHKIALRAIQAGEAVIKYGFAIGRASTEIAAGAHVHSQNLETGLAGVEDLAFAPAPAAELAVGQGTFQGYRRADGRVGVRNELWILTTVGCVTRTAQRLAKLGAEKFGDVVDGVHAFTHPYGCSQLGEDLAHTRKIIAGLAAHPNAGGVLIVGLGCESNQLDALLAEIPDSLRARVRSFAAQAEGDEIEAGLALLGELAALAAADKRETCSAGELVIGLKCGGSDGFSGLTANPLVGAVAELVVGAGGSAILTEIPEVFGAESVLLERAKDQAIFNSALALINDFKRYFIDHGQPVHENPSPGNKAGGITTLEEKSLGAVQKGGRAPLNSVLRYGDIVSTPGLSLLESPGNDAVSSTALAAAGAVIILFTTGRGTPLGFPAPTLKISSNSALAQRKGNWIDFDAGVTVNGVSREQASDDLFALVLETASGTATRSELNDEREIAIWKTGVTL